MARKRQVLPSWFYEQSLSRLGPDAALLYVGMVALADDYGSGEFGERLAVSVFPNSKDPTRKMCDTVAALFGRVGLFCGSSCGCFYSIDRWDETQHVSHPGKRRFDCAKKDPVAPKDVYEIITGKKVLIDDSARRRVLTTRERLAQEVFSVWCDVMGVKGNAVFSEKRKKAVFGRVDDGYSISEFKKAIFNCSISPFHQGQNDRKKKYNDIELICRSPEHFERFRDMPDPLETEGFSQSKAETICKNIAAEFGGFDKMIADYGFAPWTHKDESGIIRIYYKGPSSSGTFNRKVNGLPELDPRKILDKYGRG